MAINPVNNAATLPPQALPKQGGNNVNVNNKINNPVVAPHNDTGNDGDKDDTGVKKTTAVQPQESNPSVKKTLSKFA
jgi:hypothetical protein